MGCRTKRSCRVTKLTNHVEKRIYFFYLRMMSMMQPIVSQRRKIRPIALYLPAVRNTDEVSIEWPFFLAQLMRLDRFWCHSNIIKVDDASESPHSKEINWRQWRNKRKLVISFLKRLEIERNKFKPPREQ